MQCELRGGVGPGMEPWSGPESNQWDEKKRAEVPGGRYLTKNGEPKDIDYNAGGQGKKGKKNLRRRNTEHKEKKINNSRELLNQEGEKTIYI